MVDKVSHIWMDGKLVPWDESRVHVLTHSLHYGLGAFEGIRAYETHDGRPAVYRLEDHIRRLEDSCRIARMKMTFSRGEIKEACKQTLAANGLKEGYIRPVAYIGEGVMGVHPANNPIHLFIATWTWGAYLGTEAIEKGIRTKVSSFTRFNPNTIMTRAKLTGNYATGILAKMESKDGGYDEAIMLDGEGFVAEGSGENIFMVRDGKLKTPPLTCILPGITRDTVMTIAREEGLDLVEQRFSRDELYTADEAFFTGTAAEVTPIREVDNRPVGAGKPGPVTKRIQKRFFDIVKGRDDRHADWLDYYEIPSAKKAATA